LPDAVCSSAEPAQSLMTSLPLFRFPDRFLLGVGMNLKLLEFKEPLSFSHAFNFSV
jgi:hypothetical protein